ncbi:MAG: FkbM family methyltransferase [Candidatus Hydrogenedentota bacterium]
MSILKSLARVTVLMFIPLFLTACQDQSESTNFDAPEVEPLNEHDLLIAKQVADFGLDAGEVTDEDRAIYGARAGFFEWTESLKRPPTADKDWRSVLGDHLADAEPMWSQAFEELIVRDYFEDKRGGFFLDVGCYRPKNNSTTYYLERMLGWNGIGIDAMEKYADPWAKHRPGSKFISYAVSDTDGDTVTFHIGNFANSLDEDTISDFGGKVREIEVTTMTLNTILEENGIEKVDFLSMDIEGAEPMALRGFDIQRYKPDLCCVEASASQEVLDYFAANGYELIEKYKKVDKINSYFRPKSGA